MLAVPGWLESQRLPNAAPVASAEKNMRTRHGCLLNLKFRLP